MINTNDIEFTNCVAYESSETKIERLQQRIAKLEVDQNQYEDLIADYDDKIEALEAAIDTYWAWIRADPHANWKERQAMKEAMGALEEQND